ncbi:L-threonylcarbamoyladenylate synthase [Cupriavidus sp. 8B]
MTACCSNSTVESLAEVLRSGGVVGYPTEAVMGLGCDPCNETAVRRICHLKVRSVSQGLLLIAADFGQIAGFLDLRGISEDRLREVTETWPGPHTWVFPRSEHVPSWVSGTRGGIAVRVTAHPPARALCRAFGGALVSTSANPSGEPPAVNTEQLKRYFGRALDGVLDAPVGTLSRPTVIRDVITGQVMRA